MEYCTVSLLLCSTVFIFYFVVQYSLWWFEVVCGAILYSLFITVQYSIYILFCGAVQFVLVCGGLYSTLEYSEVCTLLFVI